VSAKAKQGEIGVADADVVDHDWLVGEDIFVFGGHSTGGGAAGQRMAVCVGGSELALGSTVWRVRDASWLRVPESSQP
jgi:hypothetical protein